jgi:hypothetical protein
MIVKTSGICIETTGLQRVKLAVMGINMLSFLHENCPAVRAL